MDEKWKGSFVPFVEGDGEDPDLEILFGFRNADEEKDYYAKLQNEPHPRGDVPFTDEALAEMTEPVSTSVVVENRYPRAKRKWSAEAALRVRIPADTREVYRWDGITVRTGLADSPSNVGPDIYGVAFTESEIEELADVTSPSAVVKTFAAASDEQSVLLGSWRANNGQT